MFSEMNKVKLSGIITRIKPEKTGTYVTLRIGSGDKANFPTICFSSKKIRKELAGYKRGDAVYVEAKLRPDHVMKEHEVTYTRQIVEAVKIEKAVSDLSEVFKVEMEEVVHFQNEVFIKGELSYVGNNGRSLISMVVRPEGEVNDLWVNYFVHGDIKKEVERLSKSENICIYGEVQTKVKEDGKKFENVTVKSIAEY